MRAPASSTLYPFSEVEVIDLPTSEFTDVWLLMAPANPTLNPFSMICFRFKGLLAFDVLRSRGLLADVEPVFWVW